MIRLDKSTRSLRAVLGGAVAATQPDVVVSFTDKGSSIGRGFYQRTKLSTTSGATPVTICDAPDAVTIREVDFVSIRNNDSASVTVTVSILDGSTSYSLITVALATLEHLFYSHASGWYVIGVGGGIKTNPKGTWTPVLTFATPGDLSVVYSVRRADWTKIGSDLININCSIVTSTFTHSTASGLLQITGLPFTSTSDANYSAFGSTQWGGITKGGYTHVVPYVGAGLAAVRFNASGSGVAVSNVVSGDLPSPGTVSLALSLTYRI